MYLLMSLDALLRIAFAIVLLFVVVPALAWPARPTATLLERLFWNLGIGITLLTLIGQILTLGNLFSLVTLLLAMGLVILIGQAVHRGVSPWRLLKRTAEDAFLAALNIFDRRVNVWRRIRRAYRRTRASLRDATARPLVRIQIAAWLTLTSIAAAIRLYRPLVSANLGFSDTYVHLYLLKLLQEGRQVDPAFGPYPRGMHFLLMAIHELTNVDQILLMNYFGVFVGVLITLAVADTARRLSGNLTAGLLAGFLFATLIGGPRQYFVLGGAFSTNDSGQAEALIAMPYRDVAQNTREFDLALIVFQRQTSTLSQELAIALLFPAAMFLLNFFRKRERWHLIGFAGCTAAIAAIHSGVVVPLVLMCAVMTMAMMLDRSLTAAAFRQAAIAGAVAVLIGSSWMFAFIAYPYAGGTSVADAALYYFPFLRSVALDQTSGPIALKDMPVFVGLTPFLICSIAVAIGLLGSSFVRRDEFRAGRIWIALVVLLFVLTHFASMLGLPRIVETTRNSQWLMMSITILLGIAIVDFASLARFVPKLRTAPAMAAVLIPVLFLWSWRVPRLDEPVIRNRLVNYSGFGGSALAVLRIEQTLEPYTWTLVSYGQEFPMVLRRGFHLSATDFLERYDPAADVIPIPTPSVFIIVEKTPHQFQINTWARRFSRAELEERLQTWVHLYQVTHRNVRVFLEDENVRVYQIERAREEVERATRQVRR